MFRWGEHKESVVRFCRFTQVSLEAEGTLQAGPTHKQHARLVATPMPKLP